MTATLESAERAEGTSSAGKKRVQGGLLDPKMLWKSTPDALRKLDPRTLWRNPVMFIVEIGAVWSTWLAIVNETWFAWLTVIWLWLTVLFANLAEAVAEGRGKAQAETLRKMLLAHDRRLRICSVDDTVWSVFVMTGLEKLFEFTDDIATSLASLQIESGQHARD